MPIISELPCSLGTGSSGTIEDINSSGGSGIATFFNFPITVSVNTPSGTGARNGALWVKSERVHSATKIYITDTPPAASTAVNLYLVLPSLQYFQVDVTQNTGVWKPVETHLKNGNDLPWLAGSLDDGSKIWLPLPVAYSTGNNHVYIETLYYWNGSSWIILFEDNRVVYKKNKAWAITGTGENIKLTEMVNFHTMYDSLANVTGRGPNLWGVSANGQRYCGITKEGTTNYITLWERRGLDFVLIAKTHITVDNVSGSFGVIDAYSNVICNTDGSKLMVAITVHQSANAKILESQLQTYTYSNGTLTKTVTAHWRTATASSTNINYQTYSDRGCLSGDPTLTKIGYISHNNNKTSADTANVTFVFDYIDNTTPSSPKVLYSWQGTRTRAQAKQANCKVFYDDVFLFGSGYAGSYGSQTCSLCLWDGSAMKYVITAFDAWTAQYYYLGGAYKWGLVVWGANTTSAQAGIWAWAIRHDTHSFLGSSPAALAKLVNLTPATGSNVTSAQLQNASAYLHSSYKASSGYAGENIALLAVNGIQLLRINTSFNANSSTAPWTINTPVHVKTLVEGTETIVAAPVTITPLVKTFVP